jgi:hypothetical protein
MRSNEACEWYLYISYLLDQCSSAFSGTKVLIRVNAGALLGAMLRRSLFVHLPPSAVSLVSDVRFRRSAQRLARLT